MELHSIRQQLNMGVALSSMKLRVTDYSRVSTDHLEQKKSLKNQVEHFDEMIKDNPNWTYVQGYVDDGISGTTDYKRDNFMRMIDDAKAGKFDLIVTKEISRFSRNTLDSIKYTRELLNYGVAVLFINDNINTALPDSELRLTIMASMAQDEIRRLSERVKFGMNRSIKNGVILGNDMMYGYKKDRISGNLYIVDQEAEVVKRLYNMYAIEKESLTKIAGIFNSEGIKTCRNKKWSVSTLTRMIKNPKYKGFYRGHTCEVIDYMTKKTILIPESEQTIYEDKERIPPIISEELWECANQRLESRKKKFGDDFKTDKIIYKNRYPFSAKIHCANCNEVFHRSKRLKASNDITWTCSMYLKRGKTFCDSPNLRESELYAMFDDIVKSLNIKVESITDILLQLYNNSKNNIAFDNRLIELTKNREKLEIKKDKLLELNIEGHLSNTEFNKRNNEFNIEIMHIDEEIAKIEQRKKNFESIMKKDEELKKILKGKISEKEVITKIIDLLLDKMIVSKINNESHNYEIKIFFNFSKKYIEKETQQKIICGVESFKKFFSKDYKFKRGYNSHSAKRYNVSYKINAYICM